MRLTDFSITEEAFDPNLNPIRAKVSLGMRVLNVDDLGFQSSRRAHVHELSHQQGAAGFAGDFGRDLRSWLGRLAMKSPLQALIQMGVVPTVTFPDRQPLLRLEHADLHDARPARRSPIWRAASCPSRALPTSPPSRSTPCSRATAST